MAQEVVGGFEIAEPIRRTLVILTLRIFIVLFLADTLYAGLLMVTVFGYIPSDWSAYYATVLWVVHTIKNILLTYLVLRLIVDWYNTLYYVSAGHLVRQRGVIHVREAIYNLADIRSIALNQSWLGRAFNFGDVILTFQIASQREEVLLYAINNPQRYEHLFSGNK